MCHFFLCSGVIKAPLKEVKEKVKFIGSSRIYRIEKGESREGLLVPSVCILSGPPGTMFGLFAV